MEINYDAIRLLTQAGKSILQFPIEEEINLEPTIPDIESVLGQDVQFYAKQLKRGDEKVILSGELSYQILCKTNQMDNSVGAIKGSIPVNQSIVMKTEDGWELFAKVEVESVSVKRINSRKLSLFALLEVKVGGCEVKEETFVSDIAYPLQKRMGTGQCCQYVDHNQGTISLRETLHIPSNRPDIEKILFYQLNARGMELKDLEEGISLRAEAYLFLIYQEEGQEERLECLEMLVPLEGVISHPNYVADSISLPKVEVMTATLTESPNEDGQMRDIHLSMDVEVNNRRYVCRTLDYLEDAYAINEHLDTKWEERKVCRNIWKPELRMKVEDSVLIPDSERLLTVFAAGGKVEVTSVEALEGELVVEGTVGMNLFYKSTNMVDGVQMENVSIPFHQTMSVPGIIESAMDLQCSVEGEVVQLTAGISEPTQVEIKALLNLNGVVKQYENVRFMTDAILEEWNEQNLPGMVAYHLMPQDSLWEVAKENRTSVECICRLNNLESEEIKKEGMILVCQCREC